MKIAKSNLKRKSLFNVTANCYINVHAVNYLTNIELESLTNRVVTRQRLGENRDSIMNVITVSDVDIDNN